MIMVGVHNYMSIVANNLYTLYMVSFLSQFIYGK